MHFTMDSLIAFEDRIKKPLDCFLLANYTRYIYRIKEQPQLISDKELIIKISFHLNFDSGIWRDISIFAKEHFNVLIDSRQIFKIKEVEVPLTAFKKKALVRYNVIDHNGKPLPTLKREETMVKGFLFLNFAARILLGSTYTLDGFEALLKAIIYAIPKAIEEREKEFAKHHAGNYPMFDLITSFISSEIEKYGYRTNDTNTLLRTRKPLIDIISQKIMNIEDRYPLSYLPQYPLLVFRDYIRLHSHNSLGVTIDAFLLECKKYLEWVEKVMNNVDSKKQKVMFNLLGHFSDNFYLWVSLPFSYSAQHYIVKLEVLEDYQSPVKASIPILESEKKKRYRLTYVIKLLLKQNKYLRLFRKEKHTWSSQCLNNAARKFAVFSKKKLLVTMYNKVDAIYNKTAHFIMASFCFLNEQWNDLFSSSWFFSISKLGDSKSYHYELSSNDITLDIINHYLYYQPATSKPEYLAIDEIFGICECAKGHLHLYTTQQKFRRNKRLLKLWVRIKADWMRVIFYWSIIASEITLFLIKLLSTQPYRETSNRGNITSEFTFIPLLSVAVTLALIYQTSSLADSITRKWRVVIVSGLALYIISSLLSLLINMTIKDRIATGLINNQITTIFFTTFLWYSFWVIFLKQKSKPIFYIVLFLLLLGIIIVI